MKNFSLAIIAKNEDEQLRRIVSAYGKYFEEIVVAYDGDPIPEIEGIRFVPYKWINDFSHKRNFLAEQIKTDYYMRIDTDDEILNADKLPTLFAKVELNKVDCIYTPYIYAKDDDGNTVAQHWRETIIRKNKNAYWKKTIHENLFVVDQNIFNGVKDTTISILHETDSLHAEESFHRNFKMLLAEYEQDKEETDPRTIAYLGRMLMGLGQWHKAIYFLEILIEKSGWNDDKYYAYVELGFCLLQIKKYQDAVSACMEALAINPNFPDAHICLGEIYIAMKDFQKAKTWLTQAVSRETPDTMYVVDPSRYTVRLNADLSACLLGLGDFENACLFFENCKRIAPNSIWVKDNEAMFKDGAEQNMYIKNFVWLMMYTKEHDQPNLKRLVESIPKNLMKDERIQAIRHEVLPPVKWSDKSIVIYCGETVEDWGDPSTISGIGGSEEAVIYLSRELVDIGYDVHVFNSCGDFEGEYNGVHYHPFYNFNRKDEFNIIVSWRANIFKSVNIKANKKYVWLHDVPQEGQFTIEELTTFDKIIVLSEYHKSLFPSFIPQDKFFLSSNGINWPDFHLNGTVRNPYRMIYASSYDRGLQHLLTNWDKIKAEIPQAELHIFYGWDTYDKMAQAGYRDWRFKEKMVGLMHQDGIFEHGRVGHKELNKEFQKSSVWVYPSHFEEISCITGMKAQANGCVPITTDYAALKETVKNGILVKGNAKDKEVLDKYIDMLITNMKDPEDLENLRSHVLEHGEEFGWHNVAKKWKEEFFAVAVNV